ncbi:MAG: ATP-binding cassette domain-containing protein [Acidimicrobiales bacterium]|jgi:ABC-type transport system involved in cytochrome bd biosynthesis fused ATPase/permease subunit
MNEDIRRLLRWLRRAQPPAGPLLRALVGGLIATATNVGLLVGAVALLVDSATRPGLRAVAGTLIVIELLAFLRSPIRFNERLSSHQLGFAAVSRWRRWLVVTIGRWNYAVWRQYASGDLLERALRDTDELQELWLRCVIPTFSVLVTALLGDVIIGLLPPHGQWWSFAALLFMVQALGLVGLFANVGPLVRCDRRLRIARGAYRGALVELSAVTPELALLGRGDFVDERVTPVRETLKRAETVLRRQRRASEGIAPFITVAALVLLGSRHPASSPTWIVVAALLALSTFEALNVVRDALDTAVAISAAAERLESLETPAVLGAQPWPNNPTIRIEGLMIQENGVVLLNDGHVTLPFGRRLAITGASGSGKSTLLRLLARLDPVEGGSILIGDTPLGEIEEHQLRRHLSYVPSEPGLTRGFARDVVQMGRVNQRDSLLDLAAVGLDVDDTTKFEELSRGERERVALVRALVTAPEIYLLDEPTSGLGQEETRAVLELLESTGATFVVATHDDQVMDWCHQVYELRDGNLVATAR